VQVGTLTVDTGTVLGHGSQGTMVFAGELGGRKVAVKRLLSAFCHVALGEVDLLIKARPFYPPDHFPRSHACSHARRCMF
jgi:hypothetical protein